MNGDDNLYDEDGSGMAKPQIIKSPLSRVVEEGGVSVDVRICRLDGWSLEIVAEDAAADESALDSARASPHTLPRHLPAGEHCHTLASGPAGLGSISEVGAATGDVLDVGCSAGPPLASIGRQNRGMKGQRVGRIAINLRGVPDQLRHGRPGDEAFAT
jgi:hypothetical protein